MPHVHGLLPSGDQYWPLFFSLFFGHHGLAHICCVTVASDNKENAPTLNLAAPRSQLGT